MTFGRLCLLMMLAGSAGSTLAENKPPIKVGTDRQLLFDPMFLETSRGIQLKMNKPYQEPVPVLVPDRPWEKHIYRYLSVALDGGVFRMWYGVWAPRDTGLDEGRKLLCYAESKDGVRWEKPDLGVLTFKGSKRNNIVGPPLQTDLGRPSARGRAGEERIAAGLPTDAWAGAGSMSGGTVFRDDHGSAEERYKLWTKYETGKEDEERGIRSGLWAMVSPDGIRWRMLKDGYPLDRSTADLPHAGDTQSIPFWDPDLNKYVGFVRIKKRPPGRGRTTSVGLITSDDFRNWTVVREIFAADQRDEDALVPGGSPRHRPVVDYYVPGGMKVPGVPNAYILLPTANYHWGEDLFPQNQDVRLATSRDLLNWWQPPEREPFLRLGADGTASAGMILANPWLIPVGDELWIYYSGIGATEKGAHPNTGGFDSGVFRARFRRDGFVSADASYDGGEFTTPLLTFAGRRLELNMDGSAGGWLQVEILSERGTPIPGYDLNVCDTIRGNSVRKHVTWQGRDDVSELAGKPVRLRFVMRSMKLFAFQFLE